MLGVVIVQIEGVAHTVEQGFAEDVLASLPYSEIPHAGHVQDVIETFIDAGWRPPE